MKKIYTILFSVLAIVAFTIQVGCEGPEGPPGADGSESCSQCHNEGTAFTAKMAQFEMSAHSLGTYYTRGGQCAACHSTEGYLAMRDFTSISEIDELSFDYQTPIGCRTCHNVHYNYDTTDWQLTTNQPVTESLFGYASPDYTSYAFDDQGNSNQCLHCHQARDRGNVPAADATGTVTTGSTHWGPHYGVQGNVMNAQAGVHIPGDNYAKGTHSNIASGCISCHMHNGDHTLSVNYNSCAPCHNSDPDLAEQKVEEMHDEVAGKMKELSDLLVAQGAMTANDDGSVSPANAEMSADLAKALWNYMVVYQDHSYGTHNPGYTRALLNNSIALIK